MILLVKHVSLVKMDNIKIKTSKQPVRIAQLGRGDSHARVVLQVNIVSTAILRVNFVHQAAIRVYQRLRVALLVPRVVIVGQAPRRVLPVPRDNIVRTLVIRVSLLRLDVVAALLAHPLHVL